MPVKIVRGIHCARSSLWPVGRVQDSWLQHPLCLFPATLHPQPPPLACAMTQAPHDHATSLTRMMGAAHKVLWMPPLAGSHISQAPTFDASACLCTSGHVMHMCYPVHALRV